ncbi:hypothetical protein ACWGLF_36890 [Streptomyces puniciscabiei]
MADGPGGARELEPEAPVHVGSRWELVAGSGADFDAGATGRAATTRSSPHPGADGPRQSPTVHQGGPRRLWDALVDIRDRLNTRIIGYCYEHRFGCVARAFDLKRGQVPTVPQQPRHFGNQRIVRPWRVAWSDACDGC